MDDSFSFYSIAPRPLLLLVLSDPTFGELLSIIKQNPFRHAIVTTRSVTTLQETLAAQVPDKQAQLTKLKKEHGAHV